MKRLLAVCSVFCVLMIGVAVVSAQKGANFAGTWALDKAKSQLQGPMQNVEGITWTVTQDDKELKREQQIQGAPPAGGPPGAAGGPPGGGGGRGMGGGGPLTVKLDGSEAVTETQRGKRTVKAKWQNDGKTLEITTVNSFGDRTATSTEHWELADGGKTLKVHRSQETPQGPVESTWVFTKK